MPFLSLSFRSCLLVAAALFLAFPASAQPDACQVQIDKPFYVTGEVIWYRLWLPAAYAGRPAVVRVQVVRPEGSVAGGFFLRAEGGAADGYFRVPYDWPSGIYRFRFTAAALPGGALVELAMIELPVFNDLEADTGAAASPVMTEATPANGSLKVTITADREVYRPRDSVRLTVAVRDERGQPVAAQLSVSVTDQELCGPEVYPGPVLFFGVPLPMTEELDSLLFLKGMVRDSDGHPFSSPLLTAWASPAAAGSIVTVDADGAFSARLPHFGGEGMVQLFDFKEDGLQVAALPTPTFPPAAAPRYTEGILRYLESSRQRKKIYQLFDRLESVPVPLPMPRSAPLREPDRRMIPANYEGLETVADFFREIPSQLNLRQRQDEYTARMFNPAPHMKKDYGGPALFIIDGHLTRDAGFVAAMELADIEAFDLYFDYARLRDSFGAIGRYGVVDIRTKSGTVDLPEADRQNSIALYGLLPPAVFPAGNLGTAEKDDSVPAFRPQVFWAPAASTDASGRAQLSFPLSDDRSVFRILVTARSSQGFMGTGEKLVRVTYGSPDSGK